MGAVKALFTDIQLALDAEDTLTLASLLHLHVGDDGDRTWIVEGMLNTVGQWMFNDPKDGLEKLLWRETDLEQRREALEPAFWIGGEWLGPSDLFICHSCAHFMSYVLGVPMDAEEPECDCGRHELPLVIKSVPAEGLPCAVNPFRCPCGSLMEIRMFESDIKQALEEKRLSLTGANWYRTLNAELGFSGYLAEPDADYDLEVSEDAE